MKKLILGLGVFIMASTIVAFEPADVHYENCRDKQPAKADCSAFKAEKKPRNVIVFIQDGVGIDQIYASRVFANGPDQPFGFERLPHQSTIRTCSLSGVTDSAAASTALGTGNKTTNGKIDIGPDNEKFSNMIELAKAAGKATGVATTDELPGATPAGFTVHSSSRTKYRDIAQSYIDVQPDLLMGGGRKWFSRASSGAPDTYVYANGGKDVVKLENHSDSKDLTGAARKEGYTVVNDEKELEALPDSCCKALCLFSETSMTYAVDRPQTCPEPTMEEMMKVALRILSKNPKGFFLIFESSNSDGASHAGNETKVVNEIAAADKAIEVAIEFANSHPDTLLLLTSDHETGGLEIKPGTYKKGDLVDATFTTKMPLLPAMHSSQRVALFATGPGAELAEKVNDNTQVFCLEKLADEK